MLWTCASPLVGCAPHADLIFDVVFFVVITSVEIQGTTTAATARLLGVSTPSPARPPLTLESVAANADTTTRELVALPGGGVVISAHAPDAGVEGIELPDHPFFLATAFQPQVGSSDSGDLHPLLGAWLQAAADSNGRA